MISEFKSSRGSISYEYINKNSEHCLILLHGFMEDHECWKDIVEGLPINLLMPDLLGYGKCVAEDSFGFTMQEQAIAMDELINQFNFNHIYVLGHSMGGYIALELSLINPDIHIGLLHSTCVEDNDEKKSNRNKTIEVLEKDPSIFIREFYWHLFAEHRKQEFASIIEKLKEKAVKIPVPNLIKTVKALRDRKDHTKTWELSGGNNIIIAGSHDKLWNKDDLEELAFLGGAEFAELSESGHMGFYEEPEGLNQTIQLWLNLG